MKYRICAVVALSVALSVGCGPDDKKGGNNGNNGANASTNNDTTGENNDTTGANNETTSTSNNETTSSSNNETTSTNNTTGTNNSTIFACFSNEDCPDGERCEDLSGNDDPECVTGERGTKTTGEECASENECASGVCIGRNDSPEICSEDCGDDMTCPNDLECAQVPFTGGSGFWCVTPDP